MSSSERPSKRQAFQTLLRDGWTSLHLDARRSGVIVPASLRLEAHLVLQYGPDLPIPILDLEVDDYGVRATLSFSRTAHLTVVPWSAVYVVACTDGRGVLYAEDVPDDVAIIPSRPVSDTASPDFDLGVPCEDDLMLPARRAARLRSIPASADTATALEDEQPLVSRRRSRPRLRVVK
jgi:stringent starvation protein B